MSASLCTQTGLHCLIIQVLNTRVWFLNIQYTSLTSVHSNLEHGLAILTESFSPLRSVSHNLSCWSPKHTTISVFTIFFTVKHVPWPIHVESRAFAKAGWYSQNFRTDQIDDWNVFRSVRSHQQRSHYSTSIQESGIKYESLRADILHILTAGDFSDHSLNFEP